MFSNWAETWVSENLSVPKPQTVRWGIVSHWIRTYICHYVQWKEGRNETFWELIFLYDYRDSRVIWCLFPLWWVCVCVLAFSWLSVIHLFCSNVNHWRIFATSVHCILHLLSSCYLMHVRYTRKWCWTWCPAYHISIIRIHVTSNNRNLDFLTTLCYLRKMGNEEQELSTQSI